MRGVEFQLRIGRRPIVFISVNGGTRNAQAEEGEDIGLTLYMGPG